jgi:hypothetical protein
MYFYSNRHNPNSTNVTLAFFRPHPDNPYYHGAGIGTGEERVNKAPNRTGTALHVYLNSLVAYDANTEYDLHWLGNNGRLTFRLVPPPSPPTLGDLTLSKAFTGIPSDWDVFDTTLVSQISFLVIGFNAAGAEIYRETVFFNSTDFRWNDATRRYEYTLRDLPLGSYRIYERGGNALGFTLNRPEPPKLATITSSGQQVEVRFDNNYTPPATPPTPPSLTIWKAFHGLTNAELPANFQIILTGPEGFSRTITRAQAIQGITFGGLALGNYTIAEANNTVSGFDITVTIDGQIRTLPYTFAIQDVNANIGINIDNYYTPTPPPSPQTGLRDFTIPAVIFLLGAAIVCIAEILRRRSKKKD